MSEKIKLGQNAHNLLRSAQIPLETAASYTSEDIMIKIILDRKFIVKYYAKYNLNATIDRIS